MHLSRSIKKFVVGIILPLSLLVIILNIWYSGSAMFFWSGNPLDVSISLGRLAGDLAVYAILSMIILIARVPWIEQLFGHDKLNRLHRWLGYTIFLTLLSHPLLLIYGYGEKSDTPFWHQAFYFLTDWRDVFSAFLALILFVIIIISSIPFIRRWLAYESWHFTHLLVYPAVLLAFSHQVNYGNFRGHLGAIVFWYALNFIFFGLLLWHRFLKPCYLAYKHQFRVQKIVVETSDVLSVYVTGNNLEKFYYQAGQFANLIFLAKGFWSPHPFSFSVAPNGKYLRFSVKRLGDFTEQILNLRPGTRMIIDGPLGIFTEKSATRSKFLFLAAGIGITPIRALVESLAGRGRDIKLLYGNRTEADIAFKDELDAIPHNHYYVLSGQNKTAPLYESGWIDIEKISRLAQDYKEREIYACGPRSMMRRLKEQLLTAGFDTKFLHYELFDL